ncbi:hypothetical protein DM558_03525 [Entomomonas moraniae]|uniref:SnoaL-like domain-containing protein n=2 Tax=Entomomonas moraniae TaxID=2213226 RepID=A0A3Q9JLL2_9GAMM|nr:hypothetical protein DM558_03525 [Entomomonas moraniae]
MSGVASAQTTTSPNFVQEEKNRALVIKFYNSFFNNHQVDEAAKVLADDYKQHNPTVPDGKAPFVSFFKDFFNENPHSRARIIRSAVDGDIVWLHVHSINGENDLGEAVVDIFRVENGKIVEHWDVIQAVPLKVENNNTMF